MSAPNSPCADLAVARRGGGEHPLVEPPPQFGAGRPGKARAIAARGVGGQRELADDQQAAAHGRQVEVHLAGGVGEDAQLQHLVDELVGDGVGVVGLGADEEQQAPADPAGDRGRRPRPAPRPPAAAGRSPPPSSAQGDARELALADLDDEGAGGQASGRGRRRRRRRPARRRLRSGASPRWSTARGRACFSSAPMANGAPSSATSSISSGTPPRARRLKSASAAVGRGGAVEARGDLLGEHHLGVLRIAPGRRSRRCSAAISLVRAEAQQSRSTSTSASSLIDSSLANMLFAGSVMPM